MYELRPVYPNELYHHGIKNQQWGVQNGPPYPLDRATHRAVVKQTRSEYKASRNDVRNAAYNYRVANAAAKKADKAETKAWQKANAKGSQKYRDRYELAKAAAKDARSTSDFYRNQYSKHLKTYTSKASELGKKAKYDESERSIRRASVNGGRMTRNMLIYGNLLGALKSQKELREWGKATEKGANFDKNANVKKYYAQKESNRTAIANSKNGINSKPRHSGNPKQTNVSASPKNATSEKNAIMREIQFRVYGNGARPSQANKEAIADLRNILKTTKGTYNKENGISTYVTPYGIFDIHYGPNGAISHISFDD